MKNSPETLKKRNELKRMWKKKIDPKSFPHKIKKICKDCGKEKLCSWQSSFTQTGKPEYRARCDECFKKYLHKIRTTDKYRKLRNKRRKIDLLKKKKIMVDYLGGKCSKCGYNKSLSALTFHHRNPKEKEYELGHIKDNNWQRVKKELDKCDLVCFNCHMEIHEELNSLKI
jgi:hypothetical protein